MSTPQKKSRVATGVLNFPMTYQQMKQLEDNTRMTQEIHRAIIGDTSLGHKGIALQVSEEKVRNDAQDEKLAGFDRKFARYGGMVTILLIGWEAYKVLVLGVH